METIIIGKLEVTTCDIGTMYWPEAKMCCEALGPGWRLPTLEELSVLYQHKEIIGGFSDDYCWSATEVSPDAVWTKVFSSGWNDQDDKTAAPYPYYVRAVRSVET